MNNELELKSRLFVSLSKFNFFFFCHSVPHYIRGHKQTYKQIRTRKRKCKTRALVPALTSIIFLGFSLFTCERKSHMLHGLFVFFFFKSTSPAPCHTGCCVFMTKGSGSMDQSQGSSSNFSSGSGSGPQRCPGPMKAPW